MKDSIASKVIRYAVLAVILVFLLFPILWVILTSLKTNSEAYWFPPSFFPQNPTLEAYITLFTENNEFFMYYKNNIIVSAVTSLITMVIAIFAGYGLSRFHFNWTKWIVAALLSSQMFPVVSRMISLYGILNDIGLINTRTGLILALTAAQIPFTVTLMSSFYDAVPYEIEEAARIDGCGRIGILWRIVTPLVKPGMLAAGMYAFLMTWDDYLHCATLIQNDSLRTLSTGVALRYLGELSFDWSLINSISVVSMVPMIVLFFFFQKYMISGLVAGAVKG